MLNFDHPHAVIDEHGVRGQAVHASLEQITGLFPNIHFSPFCECPRHAGHHIKAVMFNAVFYKDRTDAWLSCWECYQLMLKVTGG